MALPDLLLWGGINFRVFLNWSYHMENGLTKNQEYVDEFNKEFLEGQNAFFDAMDGFHEGRPKK